MIPAQMDFPTWANSDYSETIVVTENGVAADLSGMYVSMQVRRFAGGPLVFTPAIAIVDNTFEISITRAQLAQAFTVANSFAYDILITHADGIQEIYAQGVLSIQAGVTQNG